MNRSSPSFLFFLFFILFVYLFHYVHSHGTCVVPRTRGSLITNVILNEHPRHPLLKKFKFKRYSNLPNLHPNNCPHCANGGGKGAVMKAANGKWSLYEPLSSKSRFRSDHGVCGDAKDAPFPRDHEAGGKFGFPNSPIVANYKAGQIVEFVVDVTTNHNGWFEFFICDATKCGGDINEECFKKGHCHLLMREKTAVCESEMSKECGPVDEKYPGRWYLPCRKEGFEHFMGGPFMRYKLPAGFKTNHAVIQFYWVTANSCNPPGHLDYFKRYPMKAWGNCVGDGGALGGRNTMLAECGGSGFPEEFWGCADVSVGANRSTNIVDANTMPTKQPRSKLQANSQQLPKVNEAPTPTPTMVGQTQTEVPLMTQEPFAINIPESTMEPVVVSEADAAAAAPESRLRHAGMKRKCQINWRQCDGRYYKGPFGCCNQNFYCHRVNKYYSQCRRRKYGM